MALNCKRHGKPRNQVWEERQAHGGKLQRVGCIDCREEARNAPPRPQKKGPRQVVYWKGL